MTTTVASLAVGVLADAGVRCYTVPGESFLGLVDAVEQHPHMRLVSTRHESGAAFMAEGDAKVTGTPALVAATRGPGPSNLAIGVHTARQARPPWSSCSDRSTPPTRPGSGHGRRARRPVRRRGRPGGRAPPRHRPSHPARAVTGRP